MWTYDIPLKWMSNDVIYANKREFSWCPISALLQLLVIWREMCSWNTSHFTLINQNLVMETIYRIYQRKYCQEGFEVFSWNVTFSLALKVTNFKPLDVFFRSNEKTYLVLIFNVVKINNAMGEYWSVAFQLLHLKDFITLKGFYSHAA